MLYNVVRKGSGVQNKSNKMGNKVWAWALSRVVREKRIIKRTFLSFLMEQERCLFVFVQILSNQLVCKPTKRHIYVCNKNEHWYKSTKFLKWKGGTKRNFKVCVFVSKIIFNYDFTTNIFLRYEKFWVLIFFFVQHAVPCTVAKKSFVCVCLFLPVRHRSMFKQN